MAESYERTVTTNFGGTAPDTSQLQAEIEADGGIAPTCTYIETLGAETVTIWFSAALSAGEETAMDAVITAHIPITQEDLFLTIPTNPRTNNSNSYNRIAAFIYPGSDHPSISSIKVISNQDSGVTSYDVRIVAVDTNDVIASGSFSNAEEAICSLSNIANVPTSDVRMEIQSKRTGGNSSKKVYIESVAFYE